MQASSSRSSLQSLALMVTIDRSQSAMTIPDPANLLGTIVQSTRTSFIIWESAALKQVFKLNLTQPHRLLQASRMNPSGGL